MRIVFDSIIRADENGIHTNEPRRLCLPIHEQEHGNIIWCQTTRQLDRVVVIRPVWPVSTQYRVGLHLPATLQAMHKRYAKIEIQRPWMRRSTILVHIIVRNRDGLAAECHVQILLPTIHALEEIYLLQ